MIKSFPTAISTLEGRRDDGDESRIFFSVNIMKNARRFTVPNSSEKNLIKEGLKLLKIIPPTWNFILFPDIKNVFLLVEGWYESYAPTCIPTIPKLMFYLSQILSAAWGGNRFMCRIKTQFEIVEDEATKICAGAAIQFLFRVQHFPQKNNISRIFQIRSFCFFFCRLSHFLHSNNHQER